MLSKFIVFTDLCFGLAREKCWKMGDPYNDITLERNLYLFDETLSVLKQSCHIYVLHVFFFFNNSTTYILENFQTADIYRALVWNPDIFSRFHKHFPLLFQPRITRIQNSAFSQTHFYIALLRMPLHFK